VVAVSSVASPPPNRVPWGGVRSPPRLAAPRPAARRDGQRLGRRAGRGCCPLPVCVPPAPSLSKPSFVGLAVALGEESPLYRAAPAVPPQPGGAPSAGARGLAFPTGCFTELFTWFEIIKCRKEKKKRGKKYTYWCVCVPPPMTSAWVSVLHL